MTTCSLQFGVAASVLLLATLYGCGTEVTISSTSPQASSSSVAVSGKLSQGYVHGATVIADKIVSGSTTGNSQLDADEVSTTSSSSATTTAVRSEDSAYKRPPRESTAMTRSSATTPVV